MANATKYFAEFRDMFDVQWRINIHDSEFAGTTPTEFTLGASGFVISYKGDTENVFQPVIGSSVEFEFIEQTAAHTAFIDALAIANESRFTITIQRMISGSYELEWFGVLLSDQWSQVNEPLPRSCRMVAADDVGNLNSILYKSNPSTAYTGTETLLAHLVNGLNKTRALHQFGTGDVFLNVADDFVAANTNATSRFLENIRTHHESFWNMDDDGNREFMSTFDVLKNICQSQNARLFLARGTWWFIPVGAYQYDTAISFHQYDINGDFQATTTATEMALATGTDLRELAGNEKRFTPPLSEARRARDYNGNAPVIWVPYIAQSDFTTAINDFGVDYFVGQQINFVGVVNCVLPGVDPAFGSSDANERVGRIAVDVQFKCGDQYATAALAFGGQGNFGFDDGSVGTYDLPNYGVLAWSGTQGATTFLSEPFDRNVGTNQNIGLVFTTDVLPSTQSSLEITLNIRLCLFDGTFVDLDDGLNVADVPAYFGQNFRAFRADVDGGGSEITYTAAGDEVNRAIKIDDVVVLGDRIGDSDRGVLEVKTGASTWADSTGWNSLNYTGAAVGINRLAVAEILRTMRAPIPIFAGSFNVGEFDTIGSLVSMVNVLTFGTDTFMFTEFTMNVNNRILDFEVARIQRSTDAITEAVSGKKDITTDVVPGGFNPLNDMVGLSNAIGSTTTAISNLESTTAAIQTKTDLIDVTQPVDLDDMESGIVTNATNIGGINTTLAILKETFQPKGDDGNTITKVVYQNNKTDGLEMTLTQTTAAFTSNSGNSQLSITESSPGVFRVDLQDEANNSNLVIYATSKSTAPSVGIGTTTPSREFDVIGRVRASQSVEALTNVIVGERIQFDTGNQLTPAAGEIVYDGDRTTFMLGVDGTATDIENDWWICRNATGSTIAAGVPVYANGTLGASGRKTIAPMIADGSIDSRYFLGVTAAAIANGSDGLVFDRGTIRGVNTTAFNDGDVLFVSQSTAGGWTNVEPTTGMVIDAAFVVYSASNGVLAVRNLGAVATGGGTSSNSFETIAVSGQSDVVADSSTDTLNLLAGSNMEIVTNPATDAIAFSVSLTPTFTSVLTTGTITSIGAITAVGNISTNGVISAGGSMGVTGNATFGGDATISGDLYTTNLNFIGNGTSVIGTSNIAVGIPDDLEIRSNGNVVIILDYDDDETGQSFQIKSGDGTTIFQVDETGVTTGLLTTATPTPSGLLTSYQQGATITATISNHVDGNAYTAAIYDSSGVEQTANPVTIDSSGNISATAPSTIATGYEMRIQSSSTGKLLSATNTTTFQVTASRTFTFWRMQSCDSSGNPSNKKLGVLEMNYWTGTNGTGTKYPTTAATSETSISGVTISCGHQYSTGYASWEAFDRAGANEGYNDGSGSMWWTLGNNSVDVHWNQLEFSSAQTFQSVTIRVYQSFSDATHVKILGSNTGNFTGEEVECVILALDGSATGAGQTFTGNL